MRLPPLRPRIVPAPAVLALSSTLPTALPLPLSALRLRLTLAVSGLVTGPAALWAAMLRVLRTAALLTLLAGLRVGLAGLGWWNLLQRRARRERRTGRARLPRHAFSRPTRDHVVRAFRRRLPGRRKRPRRMESAWPELMPCRTFGKAHPPRCGSNHRRPHPHARRAGDKTVPFRRRTRRMGSLSLRRLRLRRGRFGRRHPAFRHCWSLSDRGCFHHWRLGFRSRGCFRSCRYFPARRRDLTGALENCRCRRLPRGIIIRKRRHLRCGRRRLGSLR